VKNPPTVNWESALSVLLRNIMGSADLNDNGIALFICTVLGTLSVFQPCIAPSDKKISE
jgi:hypothetical protein